MLAAWQEFRRGKRNKLGVLEFQSDLIYQVTQLHEELKNKTYRHGGYKHFKISDPKPRDIHKASVRDRLFHHAMHRQLYPFFDKTFIHDSYSCRVGKGTHKAMYQFFAYARKCSHNHTRTCWVLKCDIKKFFASIDQTILLEILEQRISNQNILWLLHEVIGSFSSSLSNRDIPTFARMLECPQGLPLGNLTSQLLVNIYMNEFDQYVKHQLKAKYYVRYADDFIFLSSDKKELEKLFPCIIIFLRDRLRLALHPDKVFIKTLASGVDFLGWVHFPDHRVLRTATKKRMFRRTIELEADSPVAQSYLGMLKHGNTKKLKAKVV